MRNELKRKLKKMYRGFTRQNPDRLESRQRLHSAINTYAENNQIAVVYGGIDCDGGMWNNCTTIIPANVMSVVQWEQDYYDNAEGQQWHDLAKPSEVQALESSSRDLALEAHEGGHPHLLII